MLENVQGGDWASFLAFSPGSRETCSWSVLNNE